MCYYCVRGITHTKRGERNMADYSMDDNAWNAKKADIDEWFEANPDFSANKAITDGLFSIGDSQVEMRKRYWASIAGVFAGLPNSPIGRGRQSLMDVTDKSHADTYLATLGEAYGVLYDSAYAILRTHGKSGGNLYSTMDDGRSAFVKDMVTKAKLFINSGYNAGKSQNDDKRFWVSFDDGGSIVVVDNNASMGVEEEE